MKATNYLGGAVICASLFSTHPTLAWDNPGHMAVAGLAYDELSPAQRTRLVAILKQHPGMDLITEGFPNEKPSDRAFVMAAATWPDLAKRSANYVDNGYEENDPAVTSVVFDHKMHKGYHFIDTPLWLGAGAQPQLPAIPQVNGVGVVNVLNLQLQSGETDAAKAYDLGWLLHLVGDLHQPLHAVTGVTATYPKGDVGGNDVKVQGVKGETELHAVWDDILGKTTPSDKKTHLPRLDKDVAVANQIITSIQGGTLGTNADNLDPATWTAESFNMAKKDVYNLHLEITPGDKGDELTAQIDDAYIQTATIDAKQRIHEAGHRLALLLKKVLGP